MAQNARRYVEIDVDAKKALAQLNRLAGATTKMEGHLQRMNKQFSYLGGMLKGYLGFRAIEGFFGMADAARDAQARLEATVGSTQAANRAFDDLFVVANKTGTQIDVMASSYAKLSIATRDMGASHMDVVNSLDTMTTTLAVTGASTQQVNAVLLQMTQALSSGKLAGDEFKSTYENAPALLQAWAKAMGRTTGELRDMSAAGELTTESWLKHREEIHKNMVELTGAEEPIMTLARSFVVLGNYMKRLVIRFEQNIPLFTTLATGVLFLAENMGTMLKILVSVTAGWIAARVALAVMPAVFAAVSGGVASLTAALAVLRGALIATMLFFGPAGIIAVAVGAAVYAAITYWEELSLMANLADQYFSLAYAKVAYWMAQMQTAVLEGVRGMLGSMANFAHWFAQLSVNLARAAEGSMLFSGMASGLMSVAEGASEASIYMNKLGTGIDTMEGQVSKARGAMQAAQIELENAEVTLGATNIELDNTAKKTKDVADSMNGGGGGGGGARGGAAKAANDLAKELEKVNEVLRDGKKSIADRVKALEQQIYMAGLTEKAARAATVAFDQERKITDLLSKADAAAADGKIHLAAAYRELMVEEAQATEQLIKLTEAAHQAENAAPNLAQAWEKATQEIGDGVKDAIGDTFKSVFDGSYKDASDFLKRLKDLFLNQLADIAAAILTRPLTIAVSAVGSTVTGAAQGAAQGATGGGGFSASSLANVVTSAFSKSSQSIGQGIANGLTNYNLISGSGQAAGNLATTSNLAFSTASLAGGIAANIANDKLFGDSAAVDFGGAVGSAAGAALAPVVAAAIGLGPVGWAGLAIGALVGGIAGGGLGSLFGGGEKKINPRVQFGVQGGDIIARDWRDITREEGLEVQEVMRTYNEALGQLGDILGEEAKAARKAFNSYGGVNAFGDSAAGIEAQFEAVAQAMFRGVGGALGRLLEDAFEKGGPEQMLKVAAGLEALGVAVNFIDPGAVNTMEEAAQLLNAIGADAAPAFVASMEGLAGLMVSLVTEEEKFAASMAIVDRTFADLNIKLPTSVEEFRNLVSGLDLTTHHGRWVAETLGNIAPQMKLYLDSLKEQEVVVEEVAVVVEKATDVVEESAVAIGRAADQIEKERSLEIRLMQLLGDEEGALAAVRAQELEGLDETNVALQQRIWMLEDEAVAAAAAATAREDALAREAEVVDALTASIQTFVDAAVSIVDLLAGTYQSIEEFGMSNEQIYKRRREEADRLMEALSTMTDPAQIEATVAAINGLIQSGWGLLDDTQKSRLQQDFLDYLGDVEALGLERLAIGLEEVTGSQEFNLEASVNNFGWTVDKFGISAATIGEAAGDLIRAAADVRSAAGSIPSKIVVEVQHREVA